VTSQTTRFLPHKAKVDQVAESNEEQGEEAVFEITDHGGNEKNR
jgi:hypothetical protein